MRFKEQHPHYKGCDECVAIESGMELHCDVCEADGLTQLHIQNRKAWELAESIRALGPELALALRGGLKLKQDEAFWLEMRLRLIINYIEGKEKAHSMEFMQASIVGGMFGGGKKGKGKT